MFNFFDKFKNIDEVALYAVGNGRTIPIEKVPDKMFATKMLGDGIAFVLEEDTIYAPCDCKVIMVASTKHAIGLELGNGAEILIHVGLETVNLNGEGLSSLIKEKEKVKKGDPLLKMDIDFIKGKNIDLTTPLILTSTEGYKIEKSDVNQVTKEDIVMMVKKSKE